MSVGIHSIRLCHCDFRDGDVHVQIVIRLPGRHRRQEAWPVCMGALEARATARSLAAAAQEALHPSPRPPVSKAELLQMLYEAQGVPVSDEEREEQRRSFAYGNTKIENDRITRAMIDRHADKLKDDS